MKYSIMWLFIVSMLSFSQNDMDAQIEDLCKQISNEMSEFNKTTIAVIEFSDLDGNVTDLGKFLSEEVITKLFQTKKFKVIERQLLNKVIKEQKLQVSGIVDEMSAKKLGKLLGVNAIITGTVTELAASVKVNARLIGTETGEIFGAASTEIAKDESIQRLLKVQEINIGNNEKSIRKDKLASAVMKYGFSFELIKCYKKSDGSLICEVTIINKEERDRKDDNDLLIMAKEYKQRSSRLIDDEGNIYLPEVRIGREKNSTALTVRTSVGAPNKVLFVFTEFPKEINKLNMLEIIIYNRAPGNYQDWTIQFQNILIQN